MFRSDPKIFFFFLIIIQKGTAYCKVCHPKSKLIYDDEIKEAKFKREQEWPYNNRMNPEKFACFIGNGPTSTSQKDNNIKQTMFDV